MNPVGRPRQGVTLIEIMLSLVLVSTLLLVSLTASANLIRNHTEGKRAVDAAALGGQILDEITALRFRDAQTPTFGLEAGESGSDRTGFDDVDDYQGYKSEPATHRDGTKIAGFEAWSFAVAVQPAKADSKGVVSSSDAGDPLRLITVTCTAPDGTTSEHTAIFSNVANDVAASQKVECWRRLSLRFEEQELTLTVPLRNQPDAN